MLFRSFEVKRADTLAKNQYKRQEKLGFIDLYEQLYHEIMEKRQCLTLRELAVTGNDLIAIGMKPGKEIGEILNHLLMHVLEHPEDNTTEILIKLVKTQQKFE